MFGKFRKSVRLIRQIIFHAIFAFHIKNQKLEPEKTSFYNIVI